MLETLDLTDTGLSTGGVDIAEALSLNQSLRVVRLGENQLWERFGIALGRVLPGQTGLQCLDLRHNSLRATGLAAIGDGMCGNTTLRDLCLRACHVTGARSLFASIGWLAAHGA